MADSHRPPQDHWPEALTTLLGLGLPSTDKSDLALEIDKSSIDTSNENLSKSILEKSDRVIGFPPPCTVFGLNAISTQPQIGFLTKSKLAWISDTMIVLAQYFTDELKVVERQQGKNRKWPFFTILDGTGWHLHTSLSLCPTANEELWPSPKAGLVSVANGIIRLWNIEDKSTVLYHDTHKGFYTLVQWSPYDYNLVYGMDETGRISIWNLEENSVEVTEFGFPDVTCIAVNPREPNGLIAGNISGGIGIFNLNGIESGNGKMHYFPGSDGAITNLSFQPPFHWPLNRELKLFHGPYFVTAAAGVNFLRLWDHVGNDGERVCIVGRDCEPTDPTDTNIPICWIRSWTGPGTLALVTYGRDGKIIKFCDRSDEAKSETIHSIHENKELGALVTCGSMIWSFTKDSTFILGWNTKSNKVDYGIPTYSGICSMSISPLESSIIAFGCVDGKVRIIRLSAFPNYPEIGDKEGSQEEERITRLIPLVTEKLVGKVYALAWHPSKPRLAFGTDHGRFGIIILKDGNCETMMFNAPINGRAIYTVGWGPKCFSTVWEEKNKTEKPIDGADDTLDLTNKDKFWLYLCGGNQIGMINPNGASNAYLPISKMIIEKTNAGINLGYKGGASDLLWSPDWKYLLVGYNAGRIEVYSLPYLKIVSFICVSGGYISHMAFRPAEFLDPNFLFDDGKHHRWLAIASSDGMGHIVDVGPLFNEDKMAKARDQDARVNIFDSVQEIRCHSATRIIGLAWSPHDDNLLLTTSYDGSAVIWDIKKNGPIARYEGHLHRLSKGGFHPLDPFKVITSSDEVTADCPLHIWDYRDHPYKEKQSITSSGTKVLAIRAIPAAPSTQTAMLPMENTISAFDATTLLMKNTVPSSDATTILLMESPKAAIAEKAVTLMENSYATPAASSMLPTENDENVSAAFEGRNAGRGRGCYILHKSMKLANQYQ